MRILMNDHVGVDTGSWALIFHGFNEGQVTFVDRLDDKNSQEAQTSG